MTNPTESTYTPKTLWVVSRQVRLLKIVDDAAQFEARRRKLAALAPLNETRMASGLEPLSAGPIEPGKRHWIAPGVNPVRVDSARFEAAVRTLADFGKLDGSIEVLDSPCELTPRDAAEVLAVAANNRGLRQWREVETRPVVIKAIDERIAAVKASRSQLERDSDALSSKGGEA